VNPKNQHLLTEPAGDKETALWRADFRVRRALGFHAAAPAPAAIAGLPVVADGLEGLVGDRVMQWYRAYWEGIVLCRRPPDIHESRSFDLTQATMGGKALDRLGEMS
jgi:hypothetical protein